MPHCFVAGRHPAVARVGVLAAAAAVVAFAALAGPLVKRPAQRGPVYGLQTRGVYVITRYMQQNRQHSDYLSAALSPPKWVASFVSVSPSVSVSVFGMTKQRRH